MGHLLGAGEAAEAKRATHALLGMVVVGMMVIVAVSLAVADHLGKVRKGGGGVEQDRL